MSYDEIKKIMIDSLQTEDGKKALRQLLEEPSFRELLILEHDEVKKLLRKHYFPRKLKTFGRKPLKIQSLRKPLQKVCKNSNRIL